MNILWLENISQSDTQTVGGKASSVGELYNKLTHAGIRVPNGFVLTTDLYHQFMVNNSLETKISDELNQIDTKNLEQLKHGGLKIRNLIEKGTFSDDTKKLIINSYKKLSSEFSNDLTDVAVRSSSVSEDGATDSFAGIYDTFLNINTNDALIDSIKSCYASLYNDRAIAYRKESNREFDKSIAVLVQKMVRSDLSSSGVVFTADVEAGFEDVIIINSSYGLCELVVQGESIIPDEFIVNKSRFLAGYKSIIEKKIGQKTKKMIYSHDITSNDKVCVVPVSEDLVRQFSLSDDEILKLANWATIIESHYAKYYGKDKHYDMEFAKDGITNELFLVQVRPLTTFNKPKSVFTEYSFENKPEALMSGIAVGSGAAIGKVQIVHSLDDVSEFNEGDILVTSYTSPDWEPLMRKASAVLTDFGGRTSHASIICREWGKCCLVALKKATTTLTNNQEITVNCTDGEIGLIYNKVVPFTKKNIDVSNFKFPNDIKLMLNLASPDIAFKYHNLPNKGIGLLRVEFIINNFIKVHPMALLNYKTIDDVNLHSKITELISGYNTPREYYVHKFAYGISKIATSVYPYPCIVRTSDFKSNEYAKLLGGEYFEPTEENPMIGFRGASRYYSPEFKPAFEMECEAILLARNTLGLDNIKVMIPFVRTIDDLKKVLSIMETKGLCRSESSSLEIGIMCEIPSNVILAEEFSKYADFFSIGSNDLTQLTLGLDRDSKQLVELFDERNPAVKKLLSQVIKSCNKTNTKIGICGDAPSTYPDFTEFLIKEGIDSISLSPDAILKCLKHFT